MPDGWQGLIEGSVSELGPREVSGILPRGGTILGTSRTNPYRVRGRRRTRLETLRGPASRGPRGGRREGHARRAQSAVGRARPARRRVCRRRSTTTSSATDYTFGFDTAVAVCTEAIDRLHTTAESHNRVMVVEVMGRVHGLDRRDERHRRRRGRDPHPRASAHGRGDVRGARQPPPPQGLLDHRRVGGLHAPLRSPARSGRSCRS